MQAQRGWSKNRNVPIFFVVAALCVGSAAGCESLQKKLTRKPKTPQARPTPVIQFLDYSRTMTPMDRYRKHYLLFEYWNGDLLAALQEPSLSPKRLRHASKESLGELEILQTLLSAELAERMTPIIERRTALHQKLQGGRVLALQAGVLRRNAEAETRELNRTFYWRKVEDQLQESGADYQQVLEEPEG